MLGSFKVPLSFDYIWIGVGNGISAFIVTARDSSMNYANSLYEVGGYTLGAASTMDTARDIANAHIRDDAEQYVYGIRVSEEAANRHFMLSQELLIEEEIEQINSDAPERKILLSQQFGDDGDDFDPYDFDPNEPDAHAMAIAYMMGL